MYGGPCAKSKHDTITNKLMVIVLGAVNIRDDSTLFTDMLGFDKSLWPTPNPSNKFKLERMKNTWEASITRYTNWPLLQKPSICESNSSKLPAFAQVANWGLDCWWRRKPKVLQYTLILFDTVQSTSGVSPPTLGRIFIGTSSVLLRYESRISL